MALDQSALLELLEALELADVDDSVRSATETLYQALIDAELTAVIVPRRMGAATPGPPSATAIAPARWPPPPATWSCASRSCAPGRSSHSCWNAGGGSTRR